jgi:hypothetical protein
MFADALTVGRKAMADACGANCHEVCQQSLAKVEFAVNLNV